MVTAGAGVLMVNAGGGAGFRAGAVGAGVGEAESTGTPPARAGGVRC